MRIVLFIAFVFLFLGSNLSAQSDSTVHVYMGYSMTGLTQPEFRNISRGDAFHVGVSKNGYGFIASISYSPIHENNMNLSTSSISFNFL